MDSRSTLAQRESEMGEKMGVYETADAAAVKACGGDERRSSCV